MPRVLRFPRAVLVAGAFVLLAVIAGLLLLSPGGAGAARRDADARLDQPIASGIDYTLDSLPNGLRYYVYPHASTSDRIELRLVVDAGSVQEDEDQRGLAHAVEHMVFRGTRRFPHGAIERYLESVGMRRGNDVNGTTSLDDTQFRMSVPSSRPGALDTALSMLAGIAHDATFDDSDARREAGVLMEEWRLSRDAEARAGDARDLLAYSGTRYAARPILGDTGVIHRLDVAAMRRFYEKWYRPELMAVVVVGAVDSGDVRAMIERDFGSIRGVGPRTRRPTLPEVPSAAAERAVVVDDLEVHSSSVDIMHRTRRPRYRTRLDYRTASIDWLWREVLRGRLEDTALESESPLASVEVDRRQLARRISADVVSVTAMKGQTLEALEAVSAQLAELARNGPREEEIDERTRAIVRETREAAQDGDGSASLAAEFVDHFLTGSAVFTSATAYRLARDVLPTITAEDIRSFAREREASRSALIVVAATEDDAAAKLPADTILARMRAAPAGSREARSEPLDVPRLLANRPVPGRIVTEKAIPEIKAYEWLLSNGMRVLLKPTSYTFDDVRVRAVVRGGASLASDEVYSSAYLADAIIGATGVGDIPAPRLRRWLASTSMSLDPTVADDEVALAGRTASADIEPFFQLLHLYLTSPRRDTVAFRRYQARAVSIARDRGRNPDNVFRDSVAAAFAGGLHSVKSGAQFYRDATLDDALDFWTRRTANGANFTVAIVGDFTLARMRPLVERYLASIPRGAPELPRIRELPVVARSVHHDIESGSRGRARTVIGFAGRFDLSNDNLIALNLVREVIARAMTERLREKMGGTYYVDVSAAVADVVPSNYTVTIEFESSPERIDALAAAAIEELERLRRIGPTTAEFSAAREARIRDFDGRVDDNDYWTSELTFHAAHDWPLADIPTHRREIEAVTRDEVARACAAYIPGGDYVRLTMRPRRTTP